MGKSKTIKLKLERKNGEIVLTASNLESIRVENVVIDGKISHCKMFFKTSERFEKGEVKVHTTVCNEETKVGTTFDTVLN